MDGRVWRARVRGVARVRHDWATEHPCSCFLPWLFLLPSLAENGWAYPSLPPAWTWDPGAQGCPWPWRSAACAHCRMQPRSWCPQSCQTLQTWWKTTGCLSHTPLETKPPSLRINQGDLITLSISPFHMKALLRLPLLYLKTIMINVL